jgi:hypothetical protein
MVLPQTAQIFCGSIALLPLNSGIAMKIILVLNGGNVTADSGYNNIMGVSRIN